MKSVLTCLDFVLILFFLGMNQFGQMGGMQSMGQRSTPPLAPLNQVGITVAFSIIPLGSYEYHLLTDLL